MFGGGHLHDGVVVSAEGALCHHRERLANQHLRQRGFGVAHYRGQDVYGCLWRQKQSHEIEGERKQLDSFIYFYVCLKI